MILGINFTKINGEKKKGIKGELSIKNNISVTDIQKSEISLGEHKSDGARFLFSYSTIYEPGYGKIEIEGELVYMNDPKIIKEILDVWGKKKQMTKDATREVLGQILSKCNIQALLLSRDLNLPSPIPLPRVSLGGEPPKDEKGKKKK